MSKLLAHDPQPPDRGDFMMNIMTLITTAVFDSTTIAG